MNNWSGKRYWLIGASEGLGHALAKTMSEHVDVDVSKILSREMNLDQAGDELIKATIRVANGRLTCAEALGHKEFVMTKLYRSA